MKVIKRISQKKLKINHPKNATNKNIINSTGSIPTALLNPKVIPITKNNTNINVIETL